MITADDPLYLNEILVDLGIDLNYKQLSTGSFHGEINVKEKGGVIFFHESQSTKLEIEGTVDENAYYFLLDDLAQDGLQFNGIASKPNTITLYSPGAELLCTTSKPVESTQILIPQKILRHKINSRLQSDNWGINDINRLNIGFHCHQQLKEAIDNIIKTGIGSDKAIIDCLVEYIIQPQTIDLTKGIGRPQKSNFHVYTMAIDYIHAHLDTHISIEALCNHACLSQRQLDRIFNQHAHTSIKRYIGLCKLNAIRNNLLRSYREETTIQHEASKYSIKHMSRFSKNYFNLFGEYPLETLCKQRSVA